MILLNFAHPLTSEQRSQLERMLPEPLERELQIPVDFSYELPFHEQIRQLIEQIGLPLETLQRQPLLINLPGYSPIAALLLAELHGILGFFPTILRMRPIQDSLTPAFEVAEIIHLQQVRESARTRRFQQDAQSDHDKEIL